jgi:stage IV sporulation protein FB
VRIARIAGTDILVNPPVIVLFAAAACLGYLTRGLLLAAAIIVHETAHGAAAFFLGYRLEEVKVFPLGGSLRIGGMSGYDPAAEALIALAGPVASILMSMFALVLKDHGLISLPYGKFFVAINTMIFLINLLPALPLDGGRLFRSILSFRLGIVDATRAVYLSGNIIAGLLVLLAICLGPRSPLGLSMAAAAVFLFFAGARERKMAASLAITQTGSKEGLLQKKGLLRSKTFVAAYNASGKRVISHFVPGYYHIVYVVGKNGEVLGKATEQEIISGMIRYGYNVRMEQIIRMHNQ